MMRKKIVLLFMFLLAMLGWYLYKVQLSISSKNPLSANRVDKYELKLTDKSLNLELDNETSTKSIQNLYAIETDSTLILSALNYQNKCIYFYNFKDSKLISKKCLSTEGAGGVGASQMFSGFVEHKDTLLYYNYKYQLFSFDKGMNKIATYKIGYRAKRPTDITTAPYVSTGTPMTYLNDKVYFTGFVSGEDSRDDSLNRPTFMSFDLKTQKIEYLQGYPNIYHTGYWGGYPYRIMYYCYNKISNEFVFSYPASHYIYTFNPITKKRKQIYAGSKNIAEIKAQDLYASLADANSTSGPLKHYLRNDSYNNIIYDKYRKMYYRLVTLSSNPDCTQKDMQTFPACPKKLLLLIMNENFEIIGETELPKKYFYLQNYFVDKQGLWIADTMQEKQSEEDFLKFQLFEIKAK